MLAVDKPLTKFAISPRAGALPAPRASTRKTGAGGPVTGRGTPAGKAPASRRSSAASLHKGALTHARALTHVHTQQKEALRAACGGPLRALGKGAGESPSSRPPPHCPRGLLTYWSALGEARVSRPPRRPPAGLCSAALAGGGDGGGSGPTAAQPRAAAPPTARPSAGESQPVRASESAPSSRLPWLLKKSLTLITPPPQTKGRLIPLPY